MPNPWVIFGSVVSNTLRSASESDVFVREVSTKSSTTISREEKVVSMKDKDCPADVPCARGVVRLRVKLPRSSCIDTSARTL